MKYIGIIFISLGILAGIGGCGRTQPAGDGKESQKPVPEASAAADAGPETTADTLFPGKNPAVEGRKWVLIQLNGRRVEVARSQSPAYVRLDPATSKFEGSGSCNSIFGSYELSGSEGIGFTGIGSTRMACPDMSTETAMLEALSRAKFFKVNESELMLFVEKSAPVAVFAFTKE